MPFKYFIMTSFNRLREKNCLTYYVTLLSECKENHSEEPMVGLTNLIEGAACLYLRDTEAAIKNFRNCLKRRYPSKDEYDQHVSAFALYELGSSLSNNNVSMPYTHRLHSLFLTQLYCLIF